MNTPISKQLINFAILSVAFHVGMAAETPSGPVATGDKAATLPHDAIPGANTGKISASNDAAAARLMTLVEKLKDVSRSFDKVPAERQGDKQRHTDNFLRISKLAEETFRQLKSGRISEPENAKASQLVGASFNWLEFDTMGGSTLGREANYASTMDLLRLSLYECLGRVGKVRPIVLEKPMIGKLGGNRDLIIRAITIAYIDLARPNANEVQDIRAKLIRGIDLPDKTGSVKGKMRNLDGQPAVYAFVHIRVFPSTNPIRNLADYVPVAITDENGEFEINNLPPGSYEVGLGKPGVVEIQAGKTLSVPHDIQLNFRSNGSAPGAGGA